jgi:hypothetical protein
MSNAVQRNAAAAIGERSRRLARLADGSDGFVEAQQDYLGPGWDAFFGSLHDQADAAHAAGLDYRADLSGIGRPAIGAFGGGGRLTPTDLATIGGNVALGRYTDESHAVQAAQQAHNDARQQQIVGDLQHAYDEQAQASTYAPLPESSTVTRTQGSGEASGPYVGSFGSSQPTVGRGETYSVRPTATDPHQRVLDRLPIDQRLKAEAQMAATDIQRHSMGLKEQREERLATGTGSGANQDNVQLAVQAMKEGTVPPQLPGRANKDYTAIMAEAKRQGYDLAGAATDWAATQKHIATLNGSQQLRLNQSVNALPEMLDSVETLAKEWKAGPFPVLTRANLALAKNGAWGPDAASIATRLESQIADVTADLGNVYMGGNSPTDHALELAGKNLNSSWSEKVLLDNIAQARQNVAIRRNSIKATGVAGASANNPYAPTQPVPAAAATAPAAAPSPAGGGTVKMKAPNGATRDVPADQVDHYLKLGAVKVGG